MNQMDYKESTATVRSNLSYTSQRTLPGKASFTVYLLDGSPVQIQVDKKSKGQELFDEVCFNLSPPIDEKDYFSLSFDVMEHGEMRRTWLDFTKPIAKQMINAPNRALAMNVKFYPPDPTQLLEYTRYLFYLQLRDDVAKGKMPCAFVTQALLGSYVCQADVGDWEPEMDLNFLYDFAFGPDDNSPQLIDKIVDLWKSHNGMSTGEAEMHYVENAKKLPMYGTDMHPATDSEGIDIAIGINYSGVLVFRDGVRINRIVWPKILKISYKRDFFYIRVRPAERDRYEKTIGFKCEGFKAAKRVWKIAVEHHAFFRLVRPDPRSKKIKFGSKPNLTFQTEYQVKKAGSTLRLNDYSNGTFDRYNSLGSQHSLNRSQHSLNRTQSKDYSRRALSMEDVMRHPVVPGGQEYVIEDRFEAPAAVNLDREKPKFDDRDPREVRGEAAGSQPEPARGYDPRNEDYDPRRSPREDEMDLRERRPQAPAQPFRRESDLSRDARADGPMYDGGQYEPRPEDTALDRDSRDPSFHPAEAEDMPPEIPPAPGKKDKKHKEEKSHKFRKPLVSLPWKRNKKKDKHQDHPEPEAVEEPHPEDVHMDEDYPPRPASPDRHSPTDGEYVMNRPPSPPREEVRQFNPQFKPDFSKPFITKGAHKSSFERLQDQGNLKSSLEDLRPEAAQTSYQEPVDSTNGSIDRRFGRPTEPPPPIPSLYDEPERQRPVESPPPRPTMYYEPEQQRPPEPSRPAPPAKPVGVYDRTKPARIGLGASAEVSKPRPALDVDVPADIKKEDSFERLTAEYLGTLPEPPPVPSVNRRPLSQNQNEARERFFNSTPATRPPPPPPKPVVPPKPKTRDDTSWMNPDARKSALAASSKSPGGALMDELSRKLDNRATSPDEESVASSVDVVQTPLYKTQGTLDLKTANLKMQPAGDFGPSYRRAEPPPVPPQPRNYETSERQTYQTRYSKTVPEKDLLSEFALENGMSPDNFETSYTSQTTTTTQVNIGRRTYYEQGGFA